MNDEIKEIKINTLGQLLDFVETEEKAKLLIDYITNLQQENKELNKENEKWFAVAKDFEMEAHDLWNKNNELEQENERLKELDENYPIEEELAEAYRREGDYKSRIEKITNELQRKDNNWKELKKWLNEPQITYNLDATEFGIEKIECVSVKDTLNKIKELESK